MSTNNNSITAHKQITKDGTASRQVKAIHAILSDGTPRTSRQLSEEIKMDRSSVCGRINAMKGRRDRYKVIVAKNDTCSTTQKTVEFYGLEASMLTPCTDCNPTERQKQKYFQAMKILKG